MLKDIQHGDKVKAIFVKRQALGVAKHKILHPTLAGKF